MKCVKKNISITLVGVYIAEGSTYIEEHKLKLYQEFLIEENSLRNAGLECVKISVLHRWGVQIRKRGETIQDGILRVCRSKVDYSNYLGDGG